MSLKTKLVLGLMCALLFGYLAVLGASLYRSHQERMAKASATPPTPPGAAAVAAAIDEAAVVDDGPVVDPVAIAEKDADRVHTLIQAIKSTAADVDRSVALHERGDTEGAIRRLEQLLESGASLLEAKWVLADYYAGQKKHEAARDLYVRILEMDPVREGARLKLAQTLLALRHHEAALHVALWMLEGDPFVEEPNQIAAAAYLGMDRVGEAIVHLRRQVTINRDNIVARNNLAVAFSRMGDYPGAVKLFREVLDAAPGNAITYYNLAVSYAQQNDALQAVAVLRNAVERFGHSFVSAWFPSRDFDSIRDHAVFRELESMDG